MDNQGAQTSRNNLLGLPISGVGERAHWTAMQHEQAGLDDLAPFFLDRQEALAAQQRLLGRNSRTALVELPDGCLTLVRAENVFGDLESAQAAEAPGRGKVIVTHGDGFVLIPERFAAGVA